MVKMPLHREAFASKSKRQIPHTKVTKFLPLQCLQLPLNINSVFNFCKNQLTYILLIKRENKTKIVQPANSNITNPVKHLYFHHNGVKMKSHRGLVFTRSDPIMKCENFATEAITQKVAFVSLQLA